MNKRILLLLLIAFLTILLHAQQETYSKSEEIINLMEMAKSGDAMAQYQYGMVFFEGKFMPKNEKEAFQWFDAAAKQGLPEAYAALGLCYKDGLGVEKNITEALKYFNLAASKDNALAQFNLGVLYYNGEGVNANNKEAVKWFKLAAEQGNCNAQENLGLCYYEGTGLNIDIEESYYWLSLAAALCPTEKADEYVTNKERIMAELKPEKIEEIDKKVALWLEVHKK